MYHSHKLNKADSVLVVVDVQDKLLHAIHDWPDVLENTVKMIKFAQVLEVPVVVTEQYPRGLGATNEKIRELFPQFTAYEKTVFSCFGAPGFGEKLAELGARTLVIVGIEAHICVLQTALEALARGFNVHIAADAVGSRLPANKEIGLAKMRQAGGIITSTEIALYEWLERADSKEFKTVLPLIK
ncbi:isochorismatase hydrolase [Thermosinus carboxydivorans Nor1]|uniref:Isochorismatase hydrolase n=1 Tax=Thermosinus carboxydivorans Nor1 TaxID=401526 RepID=A1HRZ6_9FIRM|nr:hydrolase [Thermosinus carboxydivorans]EAX47174.1 isochorismatase hydrolase [Thermosinus carboxydivorans Nor1]